MANHLAAESSPYLLQHADNPVKWYPWGKEAINKAKQENKPILLSIGYAACHWCHVMAHESFENPETAKIMNSFFICIKVDREERPDLDKIYQTAHYFLTQQSGGWPLTIFLAPQDLTPFFSGTYFPPQPQHSLPSFTEVLLTVADIFKEHSTAITQQNEQLRNILNYEKTISSIVLNNQPINLANKKCEDNYDPINGGFGDAPKFPHAASLEFLLQESSPLVLQTLEHMANGGIYDQLSGGFFRYTVDAEWQIPHFEKMLYDNAQLLYLYADASRRFAQPFFAQIAQQTALWIMNTLQAPAGGFYCSLNADSENREGKYYLWNIAEVKKLLSPEEYEVISSYYGLDQPPNFEKHWHFTITQPLDSLANRLKLPFNEVKNRLASGKKKLLSERDKRIPPSCDKKILTSWNALIIKALLSAGDILQEKSFIQSAERTIDFIQQNLWRNNRLLASYTHNKNHFSGYLDDYAFLLEALLVSLRTHWNTSTLYFAIDIANALLDHFFDETKGGFFFTSHDHESLLYRPKNMMDEALPSGNGIAARALLTLGYLLGETRYIKAAEKTLQAAWPTLSEYPAEHCALLLGLDQLLDPPHIIIIRGNPQEMQLWETFCKKQYNTLVFTIPNTEETLPGLLAAHKSSHKTRAYLCKGFQCLSSIQDLEELQRIML